MIDDLLAGFTQALGLLGDAVAQQVAAEVDQLRLICHLADLSGVTETKAELGTERLVAGGADGTPVVAEFLALEIGPILGISPIAAGFLIRDALNLRHRHPELWRAVLTGTVRVWQAREITRRTAAARLDRHAARWVDSQLSSVVARLPWGRTLRLLDGLIAQADPAAAERRAGEERRRRGVFLGRDVTDGVATIIARVNAPGALFFDATVDRLADILAEQGNTDTKEERRSQAVEIMATPARALFLLQSAGQPDQARGECAGHLCGRITVLPAKLLPKATIYVHIDAESLATRNGVARVERIGPAALAQVPVWLAGCQVTVRPVIDLNETPAVDCYEIPRALRAAVQLRSPIEQFPFGTVGSRALDLDHIVPFDPGGPPRQTRLANLSPLGRRAHRAKTHGGWKVAVSNPGVLRWTSPAGLGYLVGPTGTHRVRPSARPQCDVFWPRVA